MPNHVKSILSLEGDPKRIQVMLEAIQSDEIGIGSVDFNKIIPMPKSLDIEAGSRTDRGLKTYRTFIEVYTFGRSTENARRAMANIPVESEECFLSQRADIRRDEWELGKAAWHNIRQYGAPTWYEWSIRHWGTKWNAYGYGKAERRLTIKSQALKRKKSKKCAALDKQHTDAEKRQRGRRREQDDKAGMRPRFEKL